MWDGVLTTPARGERINFWKRWPCKFSLREAPRGEFTLARVFPQRFQHRKVVELQTSGDTLLNGNAPPPVRPWSSRDVKAWAHEQR